MVNKLIVAISLLLASLSWIFPDWERGWKAFAATTCFTVALGVIVIRQQRLLRRADEALKLAKSSDGMRVRQRPSSPEYGDVEATSRVDDNALLADLIHGATKSMDLLFITGRNTFDNQSDQIARAIDRGVSVRVLLFDETSPNLPAMQTLLNKDAEALIDLLSSSLASCRRLYDSAKVRDPNAESRFQVRRFGDLAAFDLVIVDSARVWYHPMMPTFEQSFPSFLLHPQPSSNYLTKLQNLYGRIFSAADREAL